MILSAAQIKVEDGNIPANIEKHKHFAELAADKGARLIIFPEMSLTGYQREQANEHAFEMIDQRLKSLKDVALAKNIYIVAGAPIKINDQLHIGQFIITPGNSVLIYTKQFLHIGTEKFEGEENFFTPNFNYNPQIEIDNEKISFAICADITNPQHPLNAHKNKSTVYAAGIFYTPGGIAEAYEQLSHYSKIYEMKVVMANFVGRSYKYDSAGQSACWDNKGNLISQLSITEEGLILLNTKA